MNNFNLGLLLDKLRRPLVWMSVSLLVTGGSHLLMVSTMVTPYLPVVTMGLAYSILASALWSLPDSMVKPQMLATAFGIMQVRKK